MKIVNKIKQKSLEEIDKTVFENLEFFYKKFIDYLSKIRN